MLSPSSLFSGLELGVLLPLPQPARPMASASRAARSFRFFMGFSFLMPCRGAPQEAAPGVGWLEKSSTPSTGTGLPVSAESWGDQSSARPVVQ